VHADTVANARVTIHNRILMKVPLPTTEALAELRPLTRAFAKRLKETLGLITTWTTARSAKHFIARKGAGVYLPAWESLRRHGIGERDSDIMMFLKAEKWPLEVGAKLKPARAIQFRGPRYNIVLGRYLLPFEEALWSTLQEGLLFRDKIHVYSTKGLDPRGRATLVQSLWNKHPSAKALCIDHSRFDAHLSEPLLSEEHQVYKIMAGGGDRLLKMLLNWQCSTKGTSKHGLRYYSKGGRCSGDVNTALGNTIISALVVLFAASDLFELSILVEGDDGVIFGPADEVDKLRLVLSAKALTLGFELKISEARTLVEVDYCSGRVLETCTGDALWVRSWPKPMVTDPYTAKPVHGKKQGEKAYGMALGMWFQYQGLPIYQEWAEYQLSWLTPGRKYDAWYDRQAADRLRPLVRRWLKGEKEYPVVDEVTRADFFLAFGVDRTSQMSLEAHLRNNRGRFPTAPQRGGSYDWGDL
jgi:hypothetical protein